MTIEARFKAAKECGNNGAANVKRTEEGDICNIRGLNGCRFQGKMSDAYTNYFYCTKKQPEKSDVYNPNRLN